MLEPLRDVLATKHIVLASSSPRRRQVLENAGLKFEVVPSSFEENLNKASFNHPYEYALATAKGKTLEVTKRLLQDGRDVDLVIGADTVLAMDGEIIEKPATKEEAFRRLSSYRGRKHHIYTGVILIQPKVAPNDTADGYAIHAFYERTEVHFTDCSDEVLWKYIETGEPMDKAGGYGTVGLGGTLVEGISGDHFNLVGFPLHHFAKELTKLYK